MSTLDQLGLPRFPLDPNSVEIRTEGGPTAFFDSLRERIATAKTRISLASLYWGTGNLEQQLIDDLRDALRRSGELSVRIVLDHSRGRRPTARGSSVDTLAPLLSEFPERVGLFLHQLPQLRRLSWLPFSMNEFAGVCHIKAFAFDDVALLSGSNLSADYFTCRQARVVLVKDPAYAAFVHELVETTARHSPKVTTNGALTGLRPSSIHPMSLSAALLRTASDAQPEGAAQTNTWAAPLFQHPRAGLTQESELLPALLGDPEPDLVLSTPYLNVPALYQRALVERVRATERRTLFLSPGPESHGFAGGRGLKALVPEGYRLLERRLEKRLGDSATFRRFVRPDWVYHAKGLWLTTATRATTIVGSSNFGERSARRDFDQGTLITTTDERLREALDQEVLDLLGHTGDVEPVPAPWHHGLAARALMPLCRTFL